jgi:hypothetical protein
VEEGDVGKGTLDSQNPKLAMAEAPTSCANCGKAEELETKLKTCNACKPHERFFHHALCCVSCALMIGRYFLVIGKRSWLTASSNMAFPLPTGESQR